jgi:hypothetical protein
MKPKTQGSGQWGDGGANLANVQCKAIWNWHDESPLCNEYMLIKMKNKINK